MKREIHALDYAVCELMAALDRLFFKNVEDWKLNRNGFNLEIMTGEYEKQKLVRIRPLDWPNSSAVLCYFDRFGSLGWIAYKGNVIAAHLNFNFAFRAEFNLQRSIIIESRDSPGEKFLLRIRQSAMVRQ